MTRPAYFDAAVLALSVKLRANALRLTKSSDKADDLVQDTIEKALREHEMYRHDTNLCGWLCIIMRNLYFVQHRRHHRTVEDPDGAYAAELQAPASQESAVELKDVERSLQAVHPLYREALLLALDGTPYSEIAQRLGIAEVTFKTRVCRARAELRVVLASKCPSSIARMEWKAAA